MPAAASVATTSGLRQTGRHARSSVCRTALILASPTTATSTSTSTTTTSSSSSTTTATTTDSRTPAASAATTPGRLPTGRASCQCASVAVGPTASAACSSDAGVRRLRCSRLTNAAALSAARTCCCHDNQTSPSRRDKTADRSPADQLSGHDDVNLVVMSAAASHCDAAVVSQPTAAATAAAASHAQRTCHPDDKQRPMTGRASDSMPRRGRPADTSDLQPQSSVSDACSPRLKHWDVAADDYAASQRPWTNNKYL